MKNKTLIILTSLFIVLSFSFSETQEQNAERKIFQTDLKIKVDGKLEEWNSIEKIPVVLAPDGKSIAPSNDLSVTTQFTFDEKEFYVGVTVRDDEMEFPDRNRPNGDGFYLVFVDPYKGEQSDRFYIFGFSGENENALRVLLNKDGDYFPGSAMSDIEMGTGKNRDDDTITFELGIPWELVIPFKPFFYEQWGLNLIYDDYDKGVRSAMVQLYPDDVYNIPAAKSRKAEIFQFVKHSPKTAEFQSNLNGTHFYHDEDKELTIAVNAPISAENWKIRYELSSGKENISSTEALSFKKGLSYIKKQVDIEAGPSDFYDLSYAIISDKGSLKYIADHGFFVLNRDDFNKSYTKLDTAGDAEGIEDEEAFKASLPTYEIRLEWIKDYMENSHPYADVRRLTGWFEELKNLARNITNGKPALFPTGTISRLAHRSSIDDTLQPYAVFVPPTYTGRSSLPLFVTLHASGIDEQSHIMSTMRSVYRRGNFIVVAPRGRGLSEWYVGHSGEDVLECIKNVKKIYHIDEKNIVLDGFAMGGYGAYRLSMLHPDIFRAVIVRSGAISPPSGIEGENILDIVERGKGVNYFIVHGDKDEMISVNNARRVSQKMTELGIAHEYVEVENAGHGNYRKWSDIFRWLNDIIVASADPRKRIIK